MSFDAETGTFSGAPDFDDAGTHAITVTATDASGASVSDTFTLTVGEGTPANIAPELGPATDQAPVAENTTLVRVLAAVDPEAAAGAQTLTYTRSGTDAARFEIRNGNELHFHTAPDFENPGSGTGTNTYDVTVRVSDGAGGEDEQAIAVNVTDVAGIVLTGTPGDDAGATALVGTPENDTIDGLAGDDEITGGDGDDTLTGGLGDDDIQGGDGNDTIIYMGGPFGIADGHDSIDGGAGEDTLVITGTNGSDEVDVFVTGNVITRLHSGAVTGVEHVTLELGNNFNDRIWYAGVTQDVTVNLSAGLATGFDSISGVRGVIAGSGNDSLTGGVNGDVLSGAEGNDELVGGGGADRLAGGDGDDVLVVNAGDVASGEVYDGGANSDTLRITASANFTGVLFNSIERLSFDGASPVTVVLDQAQASSQFSLTGNSLANSLIINMSGNSPLSLATWGAHASFLQTSSISINGTGFADTIVGTVTRDILLGGAGDDILDGLSGLQDRAVYSGNRADYAVSLGASGGIPAIILSDLRDGSPDGTDTVSRVEFFQFADGTLTLAQVLDQFDVTAPVDADGSANKANENAAAGSVVGVTAQAADADPSAVVSYALTSNPGSLFAIDTTSGVVTVAGAIDREASGPTVDIELTATSSDGSSAASIFTIAIGDVDEFDVGAPVDVDGPAGGSVAENAASGTVVGITAFAADADATSNGVTYTLSESAGGRFVINAAGVVTVADGPLLDFEADAAHAITVLATSADGSSASETFTVAVTDSDEIAPSVVSIASTGPSLTNASSVEFLVTFSEPVTGVSADQFRIATTGSISLAEVLAVTPVGGSNGTQYTVSAGTGTGDGTLVLLVDGADIRDAAGNALAHGSFAAPGSLSVGDGPVSITVGDIDGDGRIDALTSDVNGGTIGILRGNGDGTFQLNFVNAGPIPVGATAADVSGDGKADLIYSNREAGSVTVRFGNGDGTFAPIGDSYAVGRGSNSNVISIADLDGDGAADISVANSQSDTVSVLLNNGAGSFQAGVEYVVGSGPVDVANPDLNGDGAPDLVTSNQGAGTVGVRLGNGDGTFGAVTQLALGGGSLPVDLDTADVDGDGFTDLVVALRGHSAIAVLRGNGDGTFQAPVEHATGAGPLGLVLADVDGDGDSDAIVTEYFAGTASVLHNDGTGDFGAPISFLTSIGGPYDVAAADVNGDGQIDVLVANADGDAVSVIVNTFFPVGLTISVDKTSPTISGPATLEALLEDTGRLITAAELLANASDANESALQVLNLAASSGTLTDFGGGTWFFQPTANDDTEVTFTYQVSDGVNAPTAANATLDLLPVADPGIAIDKTVAGITDAGGGDGGAAVDDVGDRITYRIEVRNPGDVALTGVTVSDPLLADLVFTGGDADGDSALDAGEVWTYTGSYAVTQDDLDNNGTFDNRFSPNAMEIRVVDTHRLMFVSLGIDAAGRLTNDPAQSVKVVATSGHQASMDVIATAFEVFSTVQTPEASDPANKTILHLTTAELQAAINWTLDGENGPSPLLPLLTNFGGDIHNVATADSDQTGPMSNEASVPVVQNKELELDKSADVTSVDSTDDVITYTYTLTNGGNAAIGGIALSDDNATPDDAGDDFNPERISGDSDGDERLDVGETWVYRATRIVSATQIAAGLAIVNTASATGIGAATVTDTAVVGVETGNNAPSDIALAGVSVVENAVNGTVIGTLTGTDADGGALTFTLIDSAGGRFRIANGNQLVVNDGTLLDYDTSQTHSITVQVTDSSGLSYIESFTIALQNVVGVTQTGDGAGNTLTGTGEEDTLNGGAGNDTLRGLGGNDTLLGGTGSDTLDGGTGADTMTGGAGNDTYEVDDAGDVVSEAGGGGSDLVRSTLAAYTLGANVENLTFAGSGDFAGTGNGAANTITGGGGNDTLLGLAGNDTLVGGTGNDRLDGGTGSDDMTGGTGNDTYVVDGTGDDVNESSGGGIDTVETALTTYTLGTNVENLTLIGTANISGTGNTLANVLTGNTGNNALNGGGGNDTLIDAAGNDTLDGGSGADSMAGGIGNDTYVVDNAGDAVNEVDGEGTDTVRTSLNGHGLAAHVENLTLTGSGNISGTGNGLANVLTGNSGNNALSGGSGDDTMIGGAGGDTYEVDSAGDIVTEAGGGGTDLVRTFLAAYTLGANVENLTFTGTGSFAGNGNGAANTITGGSGNDTLLGLAGADTLVGGAGDDRLDGGTGGDTMTGGAGNDTYMVDSTGDDVNESGNGGIDAVETALNNHTLSGNVENLTLTGTGNISGSGNSLANVLTGNTGNNTLSGGGGSDTLIGGSGNDVLTGGGGADMFIFKPGFGNDRITDFDAVPNLSGAQDLIDLTDFGIASAAEFTLRVAITDIGAHTLVTIDGDPGQTIRLDDIGSIATVTVDDFRFL